jgi:hypothetical protein
MAYKVRLLKVGGAISFCVVLWLAAQLLFPVTMFECGQSTVGNAIEFTIGLSMIVALVDVILTLPYFGLRAVGGYALAFAIIILVVLGRREPLPSFDMQGLKYSAQLLLVAVPLGNVLNLAWLFDRRFREE